MVLLWRYAKLYFFFIQCDSRPKISDIVKKID